MKIPGPVLFIAVAAGVFALWVLYAIIVYCNFGGVTNAGIWGDMFGGFSALISALGFAAVVVTLYQQSRQLDEERHTRHESDLRQEKQLQMMQDQLQYFDGQLQIERKRYNRSIEPIFSIELHWKGEDDHRVEYYVKNHGSPIYFPEIHGVKQLRDDNTYGPASFKMKLDPSPLLIEGEPVLLQISPALTENNGLHFQIQYVRLDGVQTEQDFAFFGEKAWPMKGAHRLADAEQ
jgi:hypothetical protein